MTPTVGVTTIDGSTMPNTQADHLRDRARRLRNLARTIEATPAMHLEQFAGDDTWRGARPALYLDLLLCNLAQLHGAAEDLRWNAYRLEQQALAHELLDAR